MLNSSSRALRWRNTASLGRPARAEERPMCPLVVHWHHGLGLLYVAIGQHEKARTADHGYRTVSRDGDGLLATPGRAGAGAGGRAMARRKAIQPFCVTHRPMPSRH